MLVQDLNTRVVKLESGNMELVRSLEFSQKEMSGDLKTENQALKEELNGTIYASLALTEHQTWEKTQVKIQRLLRDKLSIGAVELERAHRVGPRRSPGVSRPRAVVARFVNFADRQQAIRNSSKVKSTNIFISEDLCESSVQYGFTIFTSPFDEFSTLKFSYNSNNSDSHTLANFDPEQNFLKR
ncbi:hypothetical protein E2C01_073095 [Portunus trituberculatus]|uniref:Uncharacterized protein n=1 Tax=Portunus trituberculatus TaxID=210409 RepID=A0A5B7I8I0_PORTR|nr:hypothetical protein [Portunus trituberculatus]